MRLLRTLEFETRTDALAERNIECGNDESATNAVRADAYFGMAESVIERRDGNKR